MRADLTSNLIRLKRRFIKEYTCISTAYKSGSKCKKYVVADDKAFHPEQKHHRCTGEAFLIVMNLYHYITNISARDPKSIHDQCCTTYSEAEICNMTSVWSSSISLITGSRGKTPSEIRSGLPVDEKTSSKYTRERCLQFAGAVKVVGNAKIYVIACRPDTQKKLPDGKLFIKDMIHESRYFFMRWVAEQNIYKSDQFYTIAKAKHTDRKTAGKCNIAIESTVGLKGMPNYLKASLENENVDEHVTTNKFDSYLKMFFITHRCDPPLPGTFLCENFVTGKGINQNKYGVMSDFYSFPEEKVPPKCEDYKINEKFFKMDNLLVEYQEIMKKSYNHEDFENVKLVYRDIKGSGKRKISIECSAEPKFRKKIKDVKAFFIFYQPLKVLPQARVLLAGFMGEVLWIDPFRIRMFPQFRNMDKKVQAVVGEATKAEFRMDIVLDECDVLSGIFQCAIAANVKKDKTEIFRGMYDLKRTSAAKPSSGCKGNKGDAAKTDASISLTMDKGKSAGDRNSSNIRWTLPVQIYVLLHLMYF